MNYFLTVFFILIYSSCYAVPTESSLPAEVVKVTKENNPNCVEYYNYHGNTYCSYMTINTKPMDPKLLSHEKQNIHFDSRAWKAVWGEHKNAITTIEYVPVGQTINQWNELITSQFIPGLSDVSPQEFAHRFLADLKKSGVVYTSKIIDKQKTYLILEFQVQQPSNLQQNELQKIVKTDEGIYVLHYAVKKSDMGDKQRQAWLKNLQNSSLKN